MVKTLIKGSLIELVPDICNFRYRHTTECDYCYRRPYSLIIKGDPIVCHNGVSIISIKRCLAIIHALPSAVVSSFGLTLIC